MKGLVEVSLAAQASNALCAFRDSLDLTRKKEVFCPSSVPSCRRLAHHPAPHQSMMRASQSMNMRASKVCAVVLRTHIAHVVESREGVEES